MPKVINICGADVGIVFASKYQGTLVSNAVSSKHDLERLILDNTTENTGFLLWLSNCHCFACIFQHAKKTKYFLVSCGEKQTINLFEKLNDSESVINKVCNIVKPDLKCEEIQYNIQFLSCSSQLTQSEKQKIIRKHKSTMEKRSIADMRKDKYANLEPAKKKIKTEKADLNYKSMGHFKKKAILETKAKKYKSMDPLKKSILVQTNAQKYKSINPIKKNILVETNAQKYKSMDPIKKSILVETNAQKYKSMDPIKKRILVETNAKKYKSMDPMRKKVILEKNAQNYKSMEQNKKEVHLMKNRTNMKNKYEAMDALQKAKYHGKKCEHVGRKGRAAKNNPMLHDLDDYIYRFHNKIKEGPYYICSVCNRLLYRKSVILLKKKNTTISMKITLLI